MSGAPAHRSPAIAVLGVICMALLTGTGRRSLAGSTRSTARDRLTTGAGREARSVLTVIVAVVLGGAAIVGLLVRRHHTRGRAQDHPLAPLEGLSISELVVPARTLAPLVLAFVVVTVHSSYEDVERQASTEAAAVLAMGEDSVLLSPEARGDVVGRLRCYARSVLTSDWQAQAQGAPSVLTDAEADRLTLALGRAVADGRNATAAGALLDDNALRIQTRLQRYEDGRPSVPNVVWVLLLLTMAIMIGGLAALARPGIRRGMHLTVLVATTAVFGLTLLVIDDLDHPYSGLARIEPSAMSTVEHRLAALSPGTPVPRCDDSRPR